MKVTFLYQYFKGLGAPGHSIIYDVTQYLAKRHHDVVVVSGETGYMSPEVSLLPWYRRLLRREMEGQVSVVRTYSYTRLHKSYLGRLWSFLSFTISSIYGLFMGGRPDVIYASSPPLFPMMSALLVSKFMRVPLIVEVRDLWPASAVQLGVVRNKFLISVMAWMESLLYRHAHKVVALTEGIRDDICARGFSEGKIELVRCGVDMELLFPDVDSAREVRSANGWSERKVIMYFGALGEANNISVILRAAETLSSRDDVVFVLVGDGMQRTTIESELLSMRLSNVVMLPPVPKREARAMLAAADICVVTLKDIPLFGGAIPTKLLDYMACGKPVLCGVRGEARHIVESAKAGYAFDPDDHVALSDGIKGLLEDGELAQRMGLQGMEYARRVFSVEVVRERIERLLLGVSPQVISDR